MNKSFTALAEANAKHFDEHPVAHTVITVVYGVAALVAANLLAKRAAKSINTHPAIPMPQ